MTILDATFYYIKNIKVVIKYCISAFTNKMRIFFKSLYAGDIFFEVTPFHPFH